MTQINKIIAGHPMFDALVGYLMAEGGTCLALVLYANRSPSAFLQDLPFTFEGFPHASNVDVRFRVRAMMMELVAGNWPTSVDMETVPRGSDVLTADDPWDVPAIHPASAQNIRSAFVYFYEANADKISAKFGQPANWPPLLQFTRVIRNACTHDGKILIRNVNAGPVTWRGLSYTAADNGKPVLFVDLATADLLVLMHEVSALL